MKKTLVNLESPYAGDIERNTLYARFCMRDSIVNHNEAPFASHLLYTQPFILHEDIPEERELGISTGLEFTKATEKTVMYVDLGITKGMEQAMYNAERNGIIVEKRKLNKFDFDRYLNEVANIKPVPPTGRVINESEIPQPLIDFSFIGAAIAVSSIIALLVSSLLIAIGEYDLLRWLQ